MNVGRQTSRATEKKGLLDYGRSAVKRLCRRPQTRWFGVMMKGLDVQLPECQARVSVDVEELPPDATQIAIALGHLPKIHTFDIPQRVENGHRCFVARYGQQAVYVTWIALGQCYSYALDREYKLADDEAYSYSSYALPEFRGNAIHPAVRCHILHLLKEAGYERAYSFIDPKNRAAKRMPERLGYEKVGITGFVEVAGIRWYSHWDRGTFSALAKRSYLRKM
jgi:RimJ/RimL family protein N-acetyltransferase